MSHRSLYQGNLTVIPQAPPLVPALAPLRDPFAEGQALF